jgi:hypothetical protein
MTLRAWPVHAAVALLVLGAVACGDTCYDGVKNNGEDGIDCGGECTPCDTTQLPPDSVIPTCFDGIQNQGEVMIDCGGPCGACPDSVWIPVDTTTAPPVGPQPNPLVCTGNASLNDYFPLALGNYWSYVANNDYTFTDEVIDQVFLSNGQMFFRVNTSGSALATTFYRTVAVTGDVKVWITDANGQTVGQEQMFLPGSPTVGQTWVNANTGITYTVSSIDTAFTAANDCPYSELLSVTMSNGGRMVFHRGIGAVQMDLGTTSHVLWDLNIN